MSYTVFAAQEPQIAQWLDVNAGRSDFALSLKNYATKKGYLTPGQAAAVLRSIERDAVRAANPAPVLNVDTQALERVFAVASGNGLKKPAITVGTYRFSPAPMDGKNPGAIYVKGGDEGKYLGRMIGGQFISYASPEVSREVLSIAGDPLGAAIQHGRLTGRCALCMRKLSDPESTARGIGPICAEKFGW